MSQSSALDQLLFPITHGTLFFAGMDVLRTHAIYGSGDYPDGHVLADRVAVGQAGLLAHIAEP